jgi:hypothetical protein
MSAARRHLLAVLGLLSSVLCPLTLPAADSASSIEIKRITDRYALTRKRIDALLEHRLHPVPLPANPPNPFYQTPKELLDEPAVAEPDTGPVPETADISDIDTLRRFAAALKIGGVINRNGNLYLTINNTPCKVGDVITAGSRDRPIYLKLVTLTPNEFTLGLNEATLPIPIRK